MHSRSTDFEGGRAQVLFVGPLSGAVNGQTLATIQLAEQLWEREIPLVTVDTAGEFKSRLTKVFFRLVFHFRAMRKVFKKPEILYLSANSNSGIWLTILLALTGRLMACRIIVHFHSYERCALPSVSLWLLGIIVGQGGLFLFPGTTLEQQWQALGWPGPTTKSLHNAYCIRQLPESTYSTYIDTGMLRIGHLSNLSQAKGIELVLEAALELRNYSVNIELYIAGPIGDSVARNALNRAKALFKDHLHYLGEANEIVKQHFFSNIDVFLFPSLYRHEAQPLVVLEALAAGAVTYATPKGNMPSDLKGSGGDVFEEAVFVNCAANQMKAATEKLPELRALANRRFAQLKLQACDDLDSVIGWINDNEKTIC